MHRDDSPSAEPIKVAAIPIAPVSSDASAAPRLALRPKEAAAALSIGERLLWSMTNRGEIPHIKLGKCVLYPVAELERWLSEQAAGGSRKRRT